MTPELQELVARWCVAYDGANHRPLLDLPRGGKWVGARSVVFDLGGKLGPSYLAGSVPPYALGVRVVIRAGVVV